MVVRLSTRLSGRFEHPSSPQFTGRTGVGKDDGLVRLEVRRSEKGEIIQVFSPLFFSPTFPTTTTFSPYGVDFEWDV